MYNVMFGLLLSIMSIASSFIGQNIAMGADSTEQSRRIRFVFENDMVTATLNGSRAAQEFLSLLPLTLKLTDYAGTEKVGDLPSALSANDAPPGSEPSAGDIAYYAPWGNLAIFYKDFRYSDGLVILGRFDGEIELLAKPYSLTVTISSVE